MKPLNSIGAFAAAALFAWSSGPAIASSHMDAPAITLDDAANTTDVYAFVTMGLDGREYLTTALAVYPFQQPGIGPNAYQFDDAVRYGVHIALEDDVARGEPSISFEFDFETTFANEGTILQSYLGPLEPAGKGAFPANQNRRQTYTVRRTDRRLRRTTILGSGERDGLIVPPNNQGLLTRFYNQGDDGDAPAREGVADPADLDPYTHNAIAELDGGYLVFAGQRDDGFYADIQSIFDLDFTFGGPNKPFDSQAGFNVMTIVLSIPLDELPIFKKRGRGFGVRRAEPAKLAGVYATTSRPRFPRLDRRRRVPQSALFDQVGRQGNPLFAEAFLPISEKDRYNEGNPRDDFDFVDSVDNPELAGAIEALLGITLDPLVPDLRTIYTPDLIRVDLTTGPARLAGQEGFNRLSVFGGDTLVSAATGGAVPGGWPNGRRFGDDVVDIAVIALGVAGPLGADPADVNLDGVTENDISFNDVFPYAPTPQNGRALSRPATE